VKKYFLSILFFLFVFSNSFSNSQTKKEVLPLLDILVEGERKIEKNKIKEISGLKKGENFIVETDEEGKIISSYQLQTAVNKILESGYFKNVEGKIEKEEGGYIVIFKVQENPPLKEIEITGCSIFSPEELKNNWKIEKISDFPFNLKELERIQKETEELYKAKGFLGGILDYELDENGKLRIIIGEGKVEEIKIKGCELVKEEEVRFNLITKKGEFLNIYTLQNDLKRIMRMGYFKEVKYKLSPGTSKDKVIVEILLQERWKGIVKKIEFEGNKTVDSEVILDIISLKEGEELNKENLKKTIEEINSLGYFISVSPYFEEENGGIIVRFELEETPEIKKIEIKGNTKISENELKKVMKTKEGEILNFNILSEDRKKIEDYYFSKGYILTRIYNNELSEILKDEKKLTITLGEGRIEKIRIEGEKEEEVTTPEGRKEKRIVPSKLKTKEYVIRREMKIKEGEILDINKLKKDLQRIYNLGYFDDVSWKPEPGNTEDGIVVVLKILEGQPKGTLSLAAGYSSNSKWSGQFSISKDNLFGKGRKISASVEFGYITSYDLYYYEPWADKKNTSFGIHLFDTQQKRDLRTPTNILEYKEKRKGQSITLGRPIRENVRFSLTISAEKIETQQTSGPVEPLLSKKGEMRSIGLSLVKDTRNYIFDPTSGVRDSIICELAGGALGGDFNYFKSEFEGRRYYLLGKTKINFATRLRLGVFTGEKILSEIFRIGGAETLRGYQEGIFAGTKLFILNNEFRFPVSTGLKAVIFTDIANIWEKKIVRSDLKYSSGFGIRYTIPGLGPIRIDYGYNWKEKDGQLHFSFGEMF
jgi:outer membrane protein insertion porin family